MSPGKLKSIKINNSRYGSLNGTSISITSRLYTKLKATKTRQGSSMLQLLQAGRAIRGFKHLLELITSSDPNSRVVLTDRPTSKVGDEYYVNFDEYTAKGRSRFLSFYRSTGLDVAQSFLAEKFPTDFDNPDETLTNKEITKTGRHFDRVLGELAQRHKHKQQLIKKTSEILKQLQEEKKVLKGDINSLAELKKQSNTNALSNVT